MDFFYNHGLNIDRSHFYCVTINWIIIKAIYLIDVFVCVCVSTQKIRFQWLVISSIANDRSSETCLRTQASNAWARWISRCCCFTYHTIDASVFTRTLNRSEWIIRKIFNFFFSSRICHLSSATHLFVFEVLPFDFMKGTTTTFFFRNITRFFLFIYRLNVQFHNDFDDDSSSFSC